MKSPLDALAFAPGQFVIALPDQAGHRQICRVDELRVRRRDTAACPDPPECTRPTRDSGLTAEP